MRHNWHLSNFWLIVVEFKSSSRDWKPHSNFVMAIIGGKPWSPSLGTSFRMTIPPTPQATAHHDSCPISGQKSIYCNHKNPKLQTCIADSWITLNYYSPSGFLKRGNGKRRICKWCSSVGISLLVIFDDPRKKKKNYQLLVNYYFVKKKHNSYSWI